MQHNENNLRKIQQDKHENNLRKMQQSKQSVAILQGISSETLQASNIPIDDASTVSGEYLLDLIDNMSMGTSTLGDMSVKDKNFDTAGITCKICETDEYIITDTILGIIVCSRCGVEYEDIIDCKPEWKNYSDNSQIKDRCGMPTNLFFPKSSLGTQMAGPGYNKLKMLHSWGQMPYEERSLYHALSEISNKCTREKIKKCIEDDAKIIYTKITKCKHLSGKNKGQKIIHRGDNSMALKASCIYYACKINNDTRSLKEIAKLFDIPKKKMTQGYKTFLKIVNEHKIYYNPKSSDPADFISRHCRKLSIDKKYIGIAKKISINITRLGIASDHTPPSLAAASIYLMVKLYHLQITKKMISQIFNISEVTLLKTYNKIEPYKLLLTDDEKVEHLITFKNKLETST